MTYAILYNRIENNTGDEGDWPDFLGMTETEDEAIQRCRDHAERQEDPINEEDVSRNAVQTILSNADGYMRYCIVRATT